jgi:hypothetical protein
MPRSLEREALVPQPIPAEVLAKALMKAAERQVMLSNLDKLSDSATWQGRASAAAAAVLKKLSISTSTKDISNHATDLVFTILAIVEVASPPGIDWLLGVMFAAAKQEVEGRMQKSRLNEIDGYLAPPAAGNAPARKSTHESLEGIKAATEQAVDELQKFDKLLREFRKAPGVQLKTADDIQANAAKIYRARSEYFKVMQSVQQMEIGAVALRNTVENMKKYLDKYIESNRVSGKNVIEKLADENLKKGKSLAISAPFNVTSTRQPRPTDKQLKPKYDKPLPPVPTADEHNAEERLAEWLIYYFASGKAGG